MTKKYKKIEELNSPILTARENQFSSLTRYFQNSIDGNPAFILLKGEEGLGKSRLISELEQHQKKISNDTVFLTVTCEQDDHLRPFWRMSHTIFQLCSSALSLKKEHHVGTPAPTLDYKFIDFAMSNYTEDTVENIFFDVESDLSVIYKSIAGYFRSHSQKENICIVFEDVHHIDRNSADFLVHFLNDIGEGDRLLVVLCYRGDETSGENGLQRILPSMYRNSHLKEIKLPPFLVRDIPKFITSIIGENITISNDLATTLYKNTHGNPYRIQAFVQDMVMKEHLFFSDAHWTLEVPPNFFYQIPKEVEEMLVAKLPKLGKYQQQVVNALSIAKRPINLDTLSSVTGLSAGQMPYILEELTKEKYIYQEQQTYNMSSLVIAEKVIEDIEEKNLLKLYIKLAKIVEKQKEKNLPFIADLYFEGQDQKKALHYCIETGQDFHEKGLFKESLDYYEKCLPLAQVAKKNFLVQVLIAIGFLYYRIANYAKALEHFAEAKSNASKDDLDLIKKGQGLCFQAKHKYREARDFLRRVQKNLPQQDDEIIATLLSIELKKNRFSKANDYLQKLVETAPHSKIVHPLFLKNKGETYFYSGKWEEAITNLEEAFHLFKERNQVKESTETALTQANLVFYTKGVVAAWKLLGELNESVKVLEDNILHFQLLYLKGFLATELNEWEKAQKIFSNIQALGKKHGNEKTYSYGTFGLSVCTLVHERNCEEAHRLAAKTLEYVNDENDIFLGSEVYHLMAKIYLKQKNFQGVQKYVEYSKKGWKQLGIPWKIYRVHLCMVRLLTYTRNAPKALAILDKMYEKAQELQDENLLGDILLEKGMIFYQHQKKEKSKEIFTKASKLFQKQSRHYQYRKTVHLTEKCSK